MQGFNKNLRNIGQNKHLMIGIGAVVLTPIILPTVAKIGKPILKATLKNGISLYQKGKASIAEATEIWEDIIAEVQVELEMEKEKD